MKPIIFGMALLLAMPIDGSQTQGEIGLESRFFDGDQNIALATRIEHKQASNHWQSKLRLFNRADYNDETRSIFLIEEAWVAYLQNKWQLRLGHQLLNWTALEAFHPVDVLNSRNFDGKIENPEKRGEPMLMAEYLSQQGTFSAYLMPTTQDPIFPDETTRYGSINLESTRWVDKEGDTHKSYHPLQWAIRYDQTIRNTDFSIHYIDHQDRSQPVIDPPKRIYLPVTQIGGTLQHVMGPFIFKSEVAHRQFKGTNTLDQPTHTQMAAGIERAWYHPSGAESTLLIEGQRYTGVTKAERQTLGLFQNDILLGYRLGLNGFGDKELFVALIIDTEREEEYIITARATTRLTDQFKIQVGGNLVKAKENGGLQSINDTDHIYINTTYYF